MIGVLNINTLNTFPLKTVAASKSVQDMFLNSNEGGGHIKNLFLRDHKKIIF